MIDERRPIDTPLCYREDKKSREERTREKERRGSGGESHELIPGCIEALLSLWFADKLHGLNTAARVRPVAVAQKRDSEIGASGIKKIGLHRIYSAANGAFWMYRQPAESRVNPENGIYRTTDFRARPALLFFSPLSSSIFKWAEKYYS